MERKDLRHEINRVLLIIVAVAAVVGAVVLAVQAKQRHDDRNAELIESSRRIERNIQAVDPFYEPTRPAR
jgi:uncharacterized membrane protein